MLLSHLFDFEALPRNKVIFFTGANYSSNFFRFFINLLNTRYNTKIISLYITNTADWQSCRLSLEMSFLGQTSLFWLHELEVDTKLKQQIYVYLANYQGPHTIFIFANNTDNLPENISYKINLDAQINKDGNFICRLFPSVNQFKALAFIRAIQDQLHIQLTLDQVCILMQYASLIRDIKDFDAEWMHQIIKSEQSLFELSNKFLFRDRAAFYKIWLSVENSYSEQFWCAFFSEQLFRSYWFVIYQKEQNFRSAKQVSFRLPFDFVKNGWRYIDLGLLKSAHDFLYQVDYQLKHNNRSNLWLEFFLNQFFTGRFIYLHS